jgi:hypothetical protein
MVVRQSWILRSPLPSHDAFCPPVDCRSIAGFSGRAHDHAAAIGLRRYEERRVSGAASGSGRQGAPFRRASSKQGLPKRTTNLAAKSETGQRMGDVVIRATALDRRAASEYGAVRTFAYGDVTFDKSASVYVTPWRKFCSGSYAASSPAYSRFAAASCFPSLKTS